MKEDSQLSLLQDCIPCESTCCKHSDSIGSPILDRKEVSNISEIKKGGIMRVSIKGEVPYHVILEGEDREGCHFLSEEGTCQIQEAKPLDCLSYPIKAVYNGDSIDFLIDADCPASRLLTPEFIEEAKRISIGSLGRFSKKIYNHWLENSVGWIKKGGVSLEEYFRTI